MQEHFSNPFPPGGQSFGIVTGTFALSQFPNIHGRLFCLRAPSTNGYPIHIGNSRSTGSYPTNPKLPFSIEPGDVFGWFSGYSLNQFYMAGCSGSQYLQYWIEGFDDGD